MPYEKVNPIVDLSVRWLCLKAYQNHLQGCPNYGKKESCPPGCRTIDEIIDLDKPVYAVWNIFNFAHHCLRMKTKHPQWSKRQIECCLYWQPKARKQLRVEVADFLEKHFGFIIIACPEAAGINVTDTMKKIGLFLEWPPVTKTYQIVLAGQSAIYRAKAQIL